MTLATRVRVDILRAMAEHNTSKKEIFTVAAFVSWPVLRVRCIGVGGSRIGTFNFSDAMSHYGSGLMEVKLANAYKRAGSAFKEQLQQNFVILTKKGGIDVERMANTENNSKQWKGCKEATKRDGTVGVRTGHLQEISLSKKPN